MRNLTVYVTSRNNRALPLYWSLLHRTDGRYTVSAVSGTFSGF